MKLLLDTHVLIWIALNQPEKFSAQTIQLLESPNNELFVSYASIWVIAIKSSLNKPNFNISPISMVRDLKEIGIKLLPIDLSHIYSVSKLPFVHNDPFDRLLICQAEQENLQFLTADQKILQYQKSFIWDIRT
ncbi:isopropylmalate isomerase [Pasteurellaceae bacterium LFhippo2]|nr:isopropylmalate isomerase [Pasteurellaceae bacterium LFhippo2]